MVVDKKYVVSDKCVDCVHNVHEHGMWICLHHEIDVEEYDLEDGCDAFEPGVTVDYEYRLKSLRKSLKDVVEMSEKVDKGLYIKHSFLFDQVKRLADDPFVFNNMEE